jgi:anti-anti-sigma regulatory factor
MNRVSTLDATGIKTLANIYRDAKKSDCRMVLVEMNSHCFDILKRSDFHDTISKNDLFTTIGDAIQSLTEKSKAISHD